MSNISRNMTEFHNAVSQLEAPFDIYKFDCKEMIPNSVAFKLRSALLTMKFKKKSCDLYSFSQSADFLKITNKPREVLQFLEVLRVIKQNVATYLDKHFNKTISVSCSKYDRGDYLLCHDDRVDDRCVAFIYYLNYDWLNEWGGTLDIYSVDQQFNAQEIVQNVNPEFNTMIFFPVEKNTYHQVAENVSNFSRISINGWFHCDGLSWEMHQQSNVLPSPIYLPVKISATRSKACTEMCIESIFEDPMYREAIQETFISDGFIMCEGFFKQEMLDILSNEIFSNDLQWKIKGPLNKMQYKFVDLNNLQYKLLFVVNMMKTEHMFKFFKECTGLDFVGVNIEVQRWHGGHYMVSGGNDGLDRLNVLSVYLFFSHCFGEMTDDKEDLHYVFEERDTLNPKFACKPQHNTIFLVHRDSDMDSYVKYCKKVDGHAWTVIVANYFIKKNWECKVALKQYITE